MDDKLIKYIKSGINRTKTSYSVFRVYDYNINKRREILKMFLEHIGFVNGKDFKIVNYSEVSIFRNNYRVYFNNQESMMAIKLLFE